MIRRLDYGWFCESCELGDLLQLALMTSRRFDVSSEQVLRALDLLLLSEHWGAHWGGPDV